jgi:hypothetical protein
VLVSIAIIAGHRDLKFVKRLRITKLKPIFSPLEARRPTVEQNRYGT